MQTILLVLILVFMFTAYVTSPKIGSPRAMYDLLQEAAARAPVDGNAEGSYLTMRSTNGLIFGVVNLIGSEFLRTGPDILLYIFILTPGASRTDQLDFGTVYAGGNIRCFGSGR